MQLIRWRQANGLSTRKAAKLLGFSTAGHLSQIEHGKSFIGAPLALQVHVITHHIGPEPVTIADHFEAWKRAHPQESLAQRAAGRAAVRAYRHAADRPKEGHDNGKSKR